MTSLSLVAISASPSEHSKTAKFVDYVLAHSMDPSWSSEHIRLRELDATALLRGRPKDDSKLLSAIDAIARADAVVIATPIFKAAYSGLLKSFLDVLPQFGLAGKVVMPLATGGTIAHVLALDYALRPVLQSMGARHIVQSFFLAESDVRMTEDGRLSVADTVYGQLDETIHHFMCAVKTPAQDILLGHPRPDRQARVQAACA